MRENALKWHLCTSAQPSVCLSVVQTNLLPAVSLLRVMQILINFKSFTKIYPAISQISVQEATEDM